MKEVIIDLVATTLAALSVVALIGFFIPHVTRILSVIWLHALRDRLYGLAIENRWLLKTHFYRYVEFIVTGSIHIVRDATLEDSLQLLGNRATHRGKISDSRVEALRGEYMLDIGIAKSQLGNESGVEVLNEVISLAKETDGPVALRVLFGHPLPIILFPALATSIIAYALCIELRDAIGSSPKAQGKFIRSMAKRNVVMEAALKSHQPLVASCH